MTSGLPHTFSYRKTVWGVSMALAFCLSMTHAGAEVISGRIVNAEGKAMEGVMVSAFDEDRRQSTSVFSQANGSFEIDGLRDIDYQLRVRLMGYRDRTAEVESGMQNIAIKMEVATGAELEAHRPANSAFSMLQFDNARDKLNFKMMCTYCHQIGTTAFRAPEKPVDWETMITRMNGYGGLYQHTKKTIVQRLIDTYKDDAVESWPEFVPPPPPSGLATQLPWTLKQVNRLSTSSPKERMDLTRLNWRTTVTCGSRSVPPGRWQSLI